MIGLQALSQFAQLMYSESEGQDLTVVVSARDSDDTVALFSVTSDNSLLTQEAALSNVQPLDVSARGTGCFLFQVSAFCVLLVLSPYSKVAYSFLLVC